MSINKKILNGARKLNESDEADKLYDLTDALEKAIDDAIDIKTKEPYYKEGNEIYVDTRYDIISDDTIKNIFSVGARDVRDTFNEMIYESYQDTEMEYNDEMFGDIVKYISENVEEFKEFDDLEYLMRTEDICVDYLQEQIQQRIPAYVDLTPFYNTKTYLVVELNVDGADNDDIVTYVNSDEDNFDIEDVAPCVEEILKLQGRTKADFIEYYNNGDDDTSDNFFYTLKRELDNMNYYCKMCFCVETTIEDAINLYDGEFKSITLSKGVACGLISFDVGAGSLIEIELDKDVTLSKGSFTPVVDLALGSYSVENIFGPTHEFWTAGKLTVNN